jgi:dihydroorotate dehydrogenase electron transfer subunit
MTAAVSDRVQAPFGARHARIVATERHGAYTVLRCADPAGPRPRAGQFYMLRAAERWGGGADERPYLPRALSVLRAPARGDELHFLIEDVGPGTARLCELGPGDDLMLVGPLGIGFTAPELARTALLVGGGVGIAPLAIWHDQVESAGADSIGGSAQGALPPVHVRVLLGFRDAEHAAGAALLSGPRIATEDGSRGHHGLVTDLLVQELDHSERAEVYACGPPPMLEAVRALCAARDVPAQLALESGMACGYGACFGCVVQTADGYIRLCVDGPVIEAARLETALTPGAGH